jgi:hypothetical protein
VLRQSNEADHLLAGRLPALQRLPAFALSRLGVSYFSYVARRAGRTSCLQGDSLRKWGFLPVAGAAHE